MALTVVAFIVAITTVVFVHEYGHYRAALWFKVRVLRFSIGFGKPLWRWERSQPGLGFSTEFMVCAIPLGGYIKMLDEREQDVAENEAHTAFNRQALYARALIVFAGPLANVVLTLLLYVFLQFIGSQQTAAILATPVKASIAETAGIQSKDVIKRFSSNTENWQDVQSMEHLSWLLTQAIQDQEDIQLEISRQGSQILRTIDIPFAGLAIDNQPSVNALLGLSGPFTKPVIVNVIDQGPAAKAGLLRGDLVLSVDGIVISDSQHLIQFIRSAKTVQKWDVQDSHGIRRQITISPQSRDIDGMRIGRVDAVIGGEPERVWVQHGLMDSALIGLDLVWKQTQMTAKGIGNLISSPTGWQQVSGPITMAEYAGKTAGQGWRTYIQFIALISLSIGLLNLLPVPMLDGGHLMYYLWEYIVGSEPSQVWLERMQFFGIATVALLMFTALFNDMLRWVK